MVWSQYGTDSFVSVWYHDDTNSGDFQKHFGAHLPDLSLDSTIWSIARLAHTYLTGTVV